MDQSKLAQPHVTALVMTRYETVSLPGAEMRCALLLEDERGNLYVTGFKYFSNQEKLMKKAIAAMKPLKFNMKTEEAEKQNGESGESGESGADEGGSEVRDGETDTGVRGSEEAGQVGDIPRLDG